MEFVRSGAQYRENLRFWGTPVATRAADTPVKTTFSAPAQPAERLTG